MVGDCVGHSGHSGMGSPSCGLWVLYFRTCCIVVIRVAQEECDTAILNQLLEECNATTYIIRAPIRCLLTDIELEWESVDTWSGNAANIIKLLRKRLNDWVVQRATLGESTACSSTYGIMGRFMCAATAEKWNMMGDVYHWRESKEYRCIKYQGNLRLRLLRWLLGPWLLGWLFRLHTPMIQLKMSDCRNIKADRTLCQEIILTGGLVGQGPHHPGCCDANDGWQIILRTRGRITNRKGTRICRNNSLTLVGDLVGLNHPSGCVR